MFKNYLKTALRQLRRDKLSAFINIAGLGIAMASVMIIAGYVWYEWGFDRQFPEGEQIFRVTYDETISRSDGRHLATVSPPMGPALVERYPEVGASIRVRYTDEVLMVRDEYRFFENGLVYADSLFFNFFPFPFAEGNPQTALDEPNSVVITRSIADKYFGRASVLGQTLLMDGNRPLKVTGVLADSPHQTHLDFDMVASFSTFIVPQGYPVTLESWGWISFQTYVKLAKGVLPADLETKLPEFFADNFGPERAGMAKLRLQPLKDVYFGSGELMNTDQNLKGNQSYLYALTLIAILLLAVSTFNSLNLSTARSVKRSMEASVRKVLGATKGQLMRQFISENILQCLISMLLAIILFQWIKNVVADKIGWQFEMGWTDYAWWLVGFIGLAILLGILAGVYPALLVSRFHPASILKGNLPGSSTSGISLRKVLVVLQFAVTGGLVICSLVVGQQMEYLRNKQPGYDREQVVALQLQCDEFSSYFEKAKQVFGQNPNVLHLSAGDILDGDYGSLPMYLSETNREDAPTMHILGVYNDYFKTLGVEIKEGREFSDQFITDQSSGILLNEAAVSAFGFKDPIGHSIQVSNLKSGEVVGVVKDFHFHSLHDPITPLVIMMPETQMSHLLVRIRSGDLAAILSSLEQDWERIAPDEPFHYSFLDDAIQRLYNNDRRFSYLIYFFTVLTLCIACLGLYGLMAVVVNARVREIGIRKVLGARVAGIVGLLTRDFLLLVLFGTLIAAPIAWWGMSNWLQNFSYRIDISLWIFIVAGTAALSVAFLTVSFQCLQAALRNPVESLRSE